MLNKTKTDNPAGENVKKQNKRKVIVISVITMLVNVLLAVVKFYFGSHGHSSALMADGVHTAIDAATTAVIIYAVISAEKKGQDRGADLAGYTVGVIALLVGLYIIIEKFCGLIPNAFKVEYKPSKFAAIVAAGSILIKALMAFFTFKLAREAGSVNLRLDGKHHLMDALSSCVSLVGIIVAGIAWKISDSVACILIAGLIVKTAFDILIPNVKSLLNFTEVPEMENRIKSLLAMQDGVKKAENVDVDLIGDAFFVKADIFVDEKMSLKDSEVLSKRLEDMVEFEFSELKVCNLKMYPYAGTEVETCQK